MSALTKTKTGIFTYAHPPFFCLERKWIRTAHP